MTLDTETIVRTCREVHRLSRIANWQWKGMPIIQWEFPDISEFHRARMDLLQAITPMMTNMTTEAAWQRIDGPEVCEIDCHGVTFRLICKQRLAVPGSTRGVGAAHMTISRMPKFD